MIMYTPPDFRTLCTSFVMIATFKKELSPQSNASMVDLSIAKSKKLFSNFMSLTSPTSTKIIGKNYMSLKDGVDFGLSLFWSLFRKCQRWIWMNNCRRTCLLRILRFRSRGRLFYKWIYQALIHPLLALMLRNLLTFVNIVVTNRMLCLFVLGTFVPSIFYLHSLAFYYIT